MAYATVNDMVERFGLIEMIRLSTRDDALPESIDGPRVETALADAASVIDSYLRARYALPLSPIGGAAAWIAGGGSAAAPREIVRACCYLARYELAQGGEQTPSDQMVKDRDTTLAWLDAMGSSEGRLDAAPARAASDARVRDRRREIDGVALP